MTHPYNGHGGLTAEEQDKMEMTMLENAARYAWAIGLVGAFAGGWIALLRVAVWGW